jgi:hypothetical protein
MKFLAILIGTLLMLAIDISGSLLSRKLKFNYAWFSILSFINYVFIGYLQAYLGFANTGIYSAAFVALLDATFGLYLCKKLKAFVGNIDLEHNESIQLITTIITVLFGAFLGWVGSLLA